MGKHRLKGKHSTTVKSSMEKTWGEVIDADQMEDAIGTVREILEYVKELNYHPAELATAAARELLKQLLRLQKETHYLADGKSSTLRSRNPIL